MSASAQPATPLPSLNSPAFLPSQTQPPSHTQPQVAIQPAGMALLRLLGLWHLLSLDAPTVAALWAVFIARCASVPLPWQVPAAMFVAVWALYAADRLLDSRSLRAEPDAQGLEARHRFHFEHRRLFLAAIAFCCPTLVLLLRDANPAAIRLHALLGALLLVWLLLIHLRPAAHRLPKELAVGIFFPAAVFIPTVARVPALRPVLLPDALMLAAVCGLNCLFIYAWEHPDDRRQAHGSTRWATQRLPQLTRSVVLAALLLAGALLAFLPNTQRSLTFPALASAASALCLWFLHRNRNQLTPVILRSAADLALLTPAPLLFLSCFRR